MLMRWAMTIDDYMRVGGMTAEVYQTDPIAA
jgi:hypothetical protein